MIARWTNPLAMATKVMSATQSWSGPWTSKSLAMFGKIGPSWLLPGVAT